MKALVTGAAGFIGSNLVDSLLEADHEVVGLDAFTPYYARAVKVANLRAASKHERFTLIEADLRTDALGPALEGVDVVFHQAGQPGVRLSWSDGFAEYDSCNVLATQRLLEAVKDQNAGGGSQVTRFVYASSSSLYGNAPEYPTRESDLPHPHSPYAVTKLAGEHLCGLYASNWAIPTVALRYFTVYGPRQRPDMAMHRLIAAALGGPPFPMFGDGHHVRDFTYVGDIVAANLLAATTPLPPGTVMNIAGGGSTVMSELIDLVGELAGRAVPVERLEPRAGDVERTGGSIDVAHERLGWKPRVSVREGVQAQIDWHRRRHSPSDDA
jgi:nucleoside-diphosphate-sugar epimerase